MGELSICWYPQDSTCCIALLQPRRALASQADAYIPLEMHRHVVEACRWVPTHWMHSHQPDPAFCRRTADQAVADLALARASGEAGDVSALLRQLRAEVDSQQDELSEARRLKAYVKWVPDTTAAPMHVPLPDHATSSMACRYKHAPRACLVTVQSASSLTVRAVIA